MRPRIRRPTVIALITTFVALGSPAGAQASPRGPGKPNCRSGRTVFRHDGIRAFVVVRFETPRSQEGSAYKTFYVCRPGSRTPRVFYRGSPFTRETMGGFRLFGQRLGFVDYSAGIQSGSDVEVGWVDLRIGRVRTAAINASEGLTDAEEAPGLPNVPVDRVKFAIASDGTVAVVGEGIEPREWEVCLLGVEPHSLGKPRQLFRARAGQDGVNPDSIAIDAASVKWRTKNGVPASATPVAPKAIEVVTKVGKQSTGGRSSTRRLGRPEPAAASRLSPILGRHVG